MSVHCGVSILCLNISSGHALPIKRKCGVSCEKLIRGRALATVRPNWAKERRNMNTRARGYIQRPEGLSHLLTFFCLSCVGYRPWRWHCQHYGHRLRSRRSLDVGFCHLLSHGPWHEDWGVRISHTYTSYTHTQKHTHTHKHKCKHKQTQTHTYTRIQAHTHTNVNFYKYTNICICVWM